MKIKLKHSLSRWIKIEALEGVELLVDYCSVEQQDVLDELKYKCYDSLKNVLYKEKDEVKINEKELFNPDFMIFLRTFLKYHIKDWKGIIDIDTNEPVKCELKNNEVENDLIREVTQDRLNTLLIFIKINSELEFTETDKKK
jgi:hypothetical protein